MNLKVAGKVFVFLLVASLIGYGFSIMGVPGKFVDSIWKLIAISLGASIITGWIFPHVRGVMNGDQLVAQVRREAVHNNVIQNFLDSYFVIAAENGRIGQKIRVRLPNGKRAEGIITSYGGTFSPATIKLTESEV